MGLGSDAGRLFLLPGLSMACAEGLHEIRNRIGEREARAVSSCVGVARRLKRDPGDIRATPNEPVLVSDRHLDALERSHRLQPYHLGAGR